jgi:hypothetical protein
MRESLERRMLSLMAVVLVDNANLELIPFAVSLDILTEVDDMASRLAPPGFATLLYFKRHRFLHLISPLRLLLTLPPHYS